MTGAEVPAVGGGALIASIAIQALKNSNWASWFNRETPKANMALSVAAAIATSAGIHLTFDAATGNGTIVFSLHQLYDAVVQWASQHLIYKQFIASPEMLGEIRALLQREAPPAISTAEAKTEQAK